MSVRERLEEQIPRLAESSYRITSPHDPDYNCVAWGLGDTARWWSPGLDPTNHWPQDLQAWPSLSVFIELFRRRGYEPCESPEAEESIEKIAIFAYPSGEPSHVARQLKGGKWTSKLGVGVDIEHDRVDAVASGLLGEVSLLMSRFNPEMERERPTLTLVR